ncbi:MAG: hypothetical protein LUE10_02930 [Alistipes sp.]|nr:hypothetical protein [Alistipes sp.]
MRNILFYSLFAALLCLLSSGRPAGGGTVYTDIDGNKVGLEDRAVVLVTSTDCGYCLRHVADHNRFARLYSDRVQMIAMYDSGAKQIGGSGRSNRAGRSNSKNVL